MNNNTTALTYSGETFNYREVKEMSTRIASSVNSEIAKQLKILSDFIRNDTFEMVKQHTAKAASAVMIPVIVFILPAMVCIVAGPLIIGVMSGDGGW